jgi:hypothetical protein
MADISTTAQDANGIAMLLSDSIKYIQYVDLTITTFYSPDAGYTGYSYTGYGFTNGVVDLSFSPQIASWSTEGQHTIATNSRGLLDKFPDRIFVITTVAEVVILNADNLDVWMRFTLASGSTGTFLGTATTVVKKALFVEGYLIVYTEGAIRIASFTKDFGYVISGASVVRSGWDLSKRNDVSFWITSSVAITNTHSTQKTLMSSDILCMDAKYINDNVLVAVGHPKGFSSVDITNIEVAGLDRSKHNELKIAVTVGGSGWEIVDDGDGDATSPIFAEDYPNPSPTNWTSAGVKAGDTVEVDFGSGNVSYQISQVNENVSGQGLVFTTEATLYQSSSANNLQYQIYRAVDAVDILYSGELILSNGHSSVAMSSSAWRDVTQSSFGGFTVAQNYSNMSGGGKVNIIVSDSDEIFVGTSQGLYRTTKPKMEAEEAAEFWYSSSSVSRYYDVIKDHTLPSTSVTSIAKDSESGHLFFAFNGTAGILFGVDLASHRLSSSTTSTTPIEGLGGFRNNNGPPNREL